MKKTVLYIFLGALLAALLIVFVRTRLAAPQKTARDGIRVVASFYPLYFFATQIGGADTEIVNITPAGAEPHDYEPTAKEIARIKQSDLLILNGGNLEPWGERMKKDLANGRTTVVAAGDGLINRNIEEDGQRIRDPHIWLSPPLAKQVSRRILQGFIGADPARTALYQANTASLVQRLDALDAEYERALASCAARDIITSHAAFGYLAYRYHLREVTITGVSPDAEPSIQKLAQITEFVKQKSVTHIFFESLVSPKLSETIARETGALTLVFDPLEGLSAADAAAGENYFSKMRANLYNLTIALQCKT